MATAPRKRKVAALQRPKVIMGIPQGSEEWKLLRCGKVTASRAADVMDFKAKGGETKERANYRTQIVSEMLTGSPADYTFDSADMRWGREQEPFARMAYRDKYGVVVHQVTFVHHPEIIEAGASPDGLIIPMGYPDDHPVGLVEIKCPRTTTHINYILANVVPDEYKWQLAMQFCCCPTVEWIDFVSFDPRLRPEMRMFVKRYTREEAAADIAALTNGINQFLAECYSIITALEQWATTA
jgi:putative phage-type endonuclease